MHGTETMIQRRENDKHSKYIVQESGFSCAVFSTGEIRGGDSGCGNGQEEVME